MVKNDRNVEDTTENLLNNYLNWGMGANNMELSHRGFAGTVINTLSDHDLIIEIWKVRIKH